MPGSTTVRGTVAVAAATGVTNVLGYVLTVVAARALVPADFGAFGALLAITIVGNVAALAVQAVSARAVVQGHSAGVPRTGLATAAAVLLLGVAAAVPMTVLLDLADLLPAIAVAAAVAALAVNAVPIGAAQGREAFDRLAALILAQGLLRVGCGVLGLVLTRTVTGATVGIAGGLVVSAAIAWVWERPVLSREPGAGHGRSVAEAAAVLLGFSVLANIDVVLARGVLSPADSGLYAAGSIVTKVAFWLPQFVPLLVFPSLNDARRRSSALRLGLLAVLVSGVLVVIVSAALAEPILGVVAGAQYVAVAPLLGWFAALGATLAIAQVGVYSGIARSDRATTALVWAAVVVIAAVVLAGPPDVGFVVRTAWAVAAVLATVIVLRESRLRVEVAASQP